MGLTELLGIDKLIKFGRIIKQIGGVRAALKQRYLMDITRAGTLVGEDKFGNKYYEDNSFFMPRNRWIPPEWYRWLHHTSDKTPVEQPFNNPKWVLDHKENLSIIPEKKYVPYSTTRNKIEGWQPGQSKKA
ncbi:hypothetical protein QR680_007742 [Steinernema hermaphroditum]|uniref:NADH dehydrogenase [ubiquinone] 1 alpha subcomplex subunit 12 n=1 Tax=Steinernema hermaphroditum TaxID=289476 RepID=A0AA39M5U3_9BILA|nr:hypothetical protein QR680_007742 [Steinernema hermaphroditum]